MDFSKLLILSRQREKMSLKELSKLSGVPVTTIFNYEHGVMPTLDKADKLLKALGVYLAIGEVQHDE